MISIFNSIPRCAIRASGSLEKHARLLAKYVASDTDQVPCYAYVIKGRTTVPPSEVYNEGDVIVSRRKIEGVVGNYSVFECNIAHGPRDENI